jgi:signal transduction histidine kinase
MRRDLTVAQWFAATVGLLVVVAVAGLVAGLLALSRLTDARELLADRLDPAALAALTLSAALVDQETGVRGFALEPQDAFLDPYRTGQADERAIAARLRPLLDVEARRRLEATSAAAAEWRSGYAMPAIAALRAGREPPSADEGKARFDQVRARLTALREGIDTARADARADLAHQASTVETIFIVFGIVLLVSVAAAAFTLQRVVVRPLRTLADDVREVSRGAFGHELETTGAREVTELGTDVDAMRRRIVAEIASLQVAQEELVRQAQELQRSNTELEQFAYVASHDLQEPLRKVASFCQMLEQRYKGQLDERADQYIAFAVDGAKRMQQLINDLLSFSRVGRLTQPHDAIDTGELVERAQRSLAAAIEESGAEVHFDGLPTVRGDGTLLGVVFQNLIGNAIKFRGDARPRIEITAERDDGMWRFRCADNGIGIEPEYADRIFVIFQRLHPRTEYEGTGIGLAMCRKIVEYHGGRIWLDGEAADGSVFLFTLPAEEATPA